MPSVVGSIIRAATRGPEARLNILTFPTHERTDTNICKTGHNFFSIRTPEVKDWNRSYAPVPPNYTLLDPQRGDNQLPPELDFDLVLSQNKFGQFQMAARLARQLQLPLVSLEHTLPMPQWGRAQMVGLKMMRGDTNVFISEFSRKAWGWGEADSVVIHHGVDTELFAPKSGVERKRHTLSVVNDWRNRDWCCGFSLWQKLSAGLPTRVLGDNPGLSRPATCPEELALEYASSRVFLNTSLVSPVPTALLEAMASGCAVVTTATCMIPEIVEDGVNGFISNEPAKLRHALDRLLADASLCDRLGKAARQTILNRFTMSRFVEDWNTVFRRAVSTPWTGALIP